jgi:hypothetical protein
MKVKVLFLIVWLGLLLFVIVGCTVGETAIMPTGTAVLIVESVDTATPQPTATSQPTAGPTSTPLPTATIALTPMPTDTVTPSPTPTTWIVVTSVSPDGNWVATSSQGVLEDTQQLSAVLQVNSTDQKWIADIVTERNSWGGLDKPIPLSWTTDGQFLFFTYLTPSDGCVLPGNGWHVYRLNLTTGLVEEITTNSGYWYAPSPNGQYLAYTSHIWPGSRIVLLDIESRTEQEIHLALESIHPDISYNSLMWSPENNALLVTADVGECASQTPLYFLIHINLDTLDQTILFDQQVGNVYRMIEWPEPEKALLQLSRGELVWVNTLTGELTPAEE